MTPTIVNLPIFNSFQLKVTLKKYILNWYLKMVECNGDQYACDRLKQLKEQVMALRSLPKRYTPTRNTRIPKHFLLPLKDKAMVRKLLMYLECRPHETLDLLKIYIRPSGKPVVSVEESATAQHQTLVKAGCIKTHYGRYVIEDFLNLFNKRTDTEHKRMKYISRHLRKENSGLSDKKAWSLAWEKILRDRLINSQLLASLPLETRTSDEVRSWWYKWNKRLNRAYQGKMSTRSTIAAASLRRFPRPALYADCRPDGTSEQFQKDLVKTLLIPRSCIRQDNGTWEPDRNSMVYRNIFMEHLSHRTGLRNLDLFNLLSKLNGDGMRQLFEDFERKSQIVNISSVYHWIIQNFMSDDMQDLSVEQILSLWPEDQIDWGDIGFGPTGQIQHIPKKGTVKRRPIAVPNRFLQFVLEPLKEEFGNYLMRCFPRDCTVKQDKFDSEIRKAQNSDDRYTGSVDLSQATDHLPYEWIEPFLSRVRSCWSQDVKNSFAAFSPATRTYWNNNGSPDRWTIGQPLGTLPSFNTMAITHNLLLEALSGAVGEFNSPYCVLGDDVVMTSRKLRHAYMNLMDCSSIPMSYHKSYENNLVEFAGKIFITNQPAYYCSDHNAIRFDNLFDYARATGVPIRWENLSRKTQEDFKRRFPRLLWKNRVAFRRLRLAAKSYPCWDNVEYVPGRNKLRNINLPRIVNLIQFMVINHQRCISGKRFLPGHDNDLALCDPQDQYIFFESLLETAKVSEESGSLATMLEDFVYVKIGPTFQGSDEDDRRTSIVQSEYLDRNICESIQDGSVSHPDSDGPTYRPFGRECSGKPGFLRCKLLICRDRLNRRYRDRVDRSEKTLPNQTWFREKFRPHDVDQLLLAGFIFMKLSIRKDGTDQT